MLKKITSLTLILVMVLTVFSFPVFAAATLSLDRTNYMVGETITITYSGVTAEQETAKSWVSVSKVGSAANSYDSWEYVNQGSGTLELIAPNESGSYEARFYQGYEATEENLVKSASVPFTVDALAPIYPKKDDFDWSLVDFEIGSASFTGTYETNYTTLSMIQRGNSVTGQYPGWDDGRIDGAVVDNVLYGYWYEEPLYAPPHDAGQIVFVMQADGNAFTGWWRYGNSGSWTIWSTGSRNILNTSGWANEEISKADALGLIPDCLKGADLTKPINRAEFAAVSVKLYENLSDSSAVVAANNPFTDTTDPEVLKAYKVEITVGTSATTFSPNDLLNREQAATMLTRVYKAATISGWTYATDASYQLPYTKPASFADDANISDWARDSVYFMASKGVIAGTGNNNFSPRNTTDAEEASNYANATREQALAISVRVAENLGGAKP